MLLLLSLFKLAMAGSCFYKTFEKRVLHKIDDKEHIALRYIIMCIQHDNSAHVYRHWRFKSILKHYISIF